MKKLSLLLAGLMIAGVTYAAPCDKDKSAKACCKDKNKTECKKEAKADCKEKSCCKKGAATAKK